ncbi:MAG: GMC family oxidoreductase [Pseudolabrys sp.]
MATKLKSADIVIVGLGWTGGILAKELADTGLSIVVLERGAPRDTNPDFMYPIIHDELRYAQRHQLMQDVSRETVTFRNNANETALPMRQLGSFLPGEGVGGAGVHWNGVTWRWLPWDHEPLKLTLGSYGRSVIPPDMQLQDWGVSYDELEHYYDKFEYLCGVSGKAGNLRGQKIEGGNVFEGARQREYPNPSMIQTHAGALFDKAAKSLGYHPFPGPSANMSQPYVNPDGVAFGTCHYCGYCERFGCEVNAKASAHFTVIPLAAQKNNVEMRTNARVMKVNLDTAKTRAESVTYIDAAGREFEQPGDLVVLCAYALGNVHLMLLSGIGKPYNPATGDGVIGRNYAYQIGSGATVFFDEKTWMNPFMGAGALAVNIDDFNTGSFDHAKEGFIGGGGISTPSAGGRPIGFRPVPPGTPAWGTEWKRAVVRHYNHALAINNQGSVMAYRQNYLDLDSTYRDRYGRPLLRMTFDFHANEQKQANFIADTCVKIGQAMGAERVVRRAPPQRYSIVPYQSTHNTGGAAMGTDPKTSALNRYCQTWDVSNVFVTGACAFPQNAGKNPTGPVGALAYWTADAIKRYLKKPEPLVPV